MLKIFKNNSDEKNTVSNGFEDEIYYYNKAIDVCKKAVETGHEAFGCILVNGDGEIVMEMTNTYPETGDITAHDVMSLVRKAVVEYDAEYLKKCSVYCTMEPCFMCMGALYWSGIPKLNYIISEETLEALFGGPSINLHSREVAEKVKDCKKIEINQCDNEELYDVAYDILSNWVKSLKG